MFGHSARRSLWPAEDSATPVSYTGVSMSPADAQQLISNLQASSHPADKKALPIAQAIYNFASEVMTNNLKNIDDRMISLVSQLSAYKYNLGNNKNSALVYWTNYLTTHLNVCTDTVVGFGDSYNKSELKKHLLGHDQPERTMQSRTPQGSPTKG